jgi:hypothetical protein
MCARSVVFSKLRDILLGSTVEQDALSSGELPIRRMRPGGCGGPRKSASCGLPIVALPHLTIGRFSTFLCFSRHRQHATVALLETH